MHQSPASPFASRRSAWEASLRMMLAAFILSAYAAIALASGVARADDGQSASGDPGATGAKTSEQTGPRTPGTGAATGGTQNPAHPPGVTHPSAPSATGRTATDHPDGSTKDDASKPHDSEGHDPQRPGTGAGAPETPKATGTATADEPTGPTVPGSVHTDTTVQPPSGPIGKDRGGVSTDPTEPPTVTLPTVDGASAATDLDAQPKPPAPTDATRNAKRFAQLASVPPPVSPDPHPAATVAPILRSVDATAATSPPITQATLAPVNPAPIPSGLRNPVPSLTGLVADLGTITVSAVHSVANAVAQVFGPVSFLGVPYLLASSIANAAAAVGGSLVGAQQFSPSTGRFAVNYGILDGLAFFNPTAPPAGADDPSIKVSPEHPLPIILINGTTATQGTNWSVGAPVLANAGYKVYTFNYGNTTGNPNSPLQALGDIKQSAAELSAEVTQVLKDTGAPKVILIGHSQGGGILPIYYINELGGADKVSQLIGISPSNHGTDLDQLIALQSIPIFGALAVGIANAIGPALYQQAVGSPFQQEVYGDGDTSEGVLYTTIASVNDEVVTPYTQQALTGSNVTNIVLQDRYPGQVLGHANIITSPQAFALVLEALASNPAANPQPVPLTTVAA